MEASFFVYLIDDIDNIYCWNCAKMRIPDEINLKFAGKANFGFDDGSEKPVCCICGRYTSRDIDI